jgi:Fe-S-cluster formation regulator IscX/YfhJ
LWAIERVVIERVVIEMAQPVPLDWDDVEGICAVIGKQETSVDPRDMGDDEIRALVARLPGFVGDPAGGNPGHMEAIRAGVWWDA